VNQLLLDCADANLVLDVTAVEGRKSSHFDGRSVDEAVHATFELPGADARLGLGEAGSAPLARLGLALQRALPSLQARAAATPSAPRCSPARSRPRAIQERVQPWHESPGSMLSAAG